MGLNLSEFIDFDLSQINIRIFDVCYFALALLMEATGDETKEEKWFVILKKLFLGYKKNNEFVSQEVESAVCVMKCIEILFIACIGIQLIRINNLLNT